MGAALPGVSVSHGGGTEREVVVRASYGSAIYALKPNSDQATSSALLKPEEKMIYVFKISENQILNTFS